MIDALSPRRLFARALAGARLNRIRFVRENSRELVLKKREVHAAPLVIAGNAYFRAAGISVRVLGERAWLAHELEVARELHGQAHARVDADRWLRVPRAPGVELAALLEDGGRPLPLKVQAIAAAARALQRLHARGILHADATCANSAFDPITGDAEWFDFETVHHGLEEPQARADDLRALMFSAAACAPRPQLEPVVKSALDAWQDGASRKCLQELVRAGGLERNPLHLAQMRTEREAHALCARLLAAG